MYSILPFQFKRFDDDVLLVNECGDFLFLSKQEFDLFVRHILGEKSVTFYNLKSKLFLSDSKKNTELAVLKSAARYRSRKAFLRDFTCLHMMVITLRCNQHCEYCQVSCAEEDAVKYDMSIETALKITDMIFQSPTKNLKIEFQGGEPTLNWKVIVATVEYAEKLSKETQKEISFVICTNLTGINEEQLLYCKEHNIFISTSLDGPEFLHNTCRVTKDKKGTYQSFIQKLELARSILDKPVDALMTTSRYSLKYMKDIVDEYIKLGFGGIFIRSLNPYGYAAEQANLLSYNMEEFVSCYLDTLKYIIEINKKRFFPEYFATLLFSRILTPFSTGFVDLQSPSGAGISGAIYDYDGSVFPADEARMLARMGDNHFCLGNVYKDSWHDIFAGNKQKMITKQSCVETTFPCAYCAYQAFCGTDPVRNYLECGQETRNMHNTPFCIKHKTIFNALFTFIKNATETDKNIIWSWINNNPDLVKRDIC